MSSDAHSTRSLFTAQDELKNTLLIPSCAKTPADKLVCSLLDGCGIEWGEASADIRRNIKLSVWVEVDGIQKHLMHTLKMKFEPGMVIRPCIVTLDSYAGDDIEGPGPPIWLERLSVPAAPPLEFIRVYNWVFIVISQVLATPDLAVTFVDPWFSLVEYIGHIKDLWDAAARPRPSRPIRPRPARQSMDRLAATFEGIDISGGSDHN